MFSLYRNYFCILDYAFIQFKLFLPLLLFCFSFFSFVVLMFLFSCNLNSFLGSETINGTQEVSSLMGKKTIFCLVK